MEGGPLRLRLPRDKAEELLTALIDRGEQLREEGTPPGSPNAADAWKHNFDRWVKLAAEGLKTIFVGDTPAKEFTDAARLRAYNMGDSWSQRHERWMEVLSRATNSLISFRERLTFSDDSSEPPAGPTPATGRGNSVFLVHGHDESLKQTVGRFLEKVIEPRVIVLAEQAELGRTIIEKFEDYASDVGYAVVLLTADDEGRKRNSDDELRPRARQNVILELGFFIGTLGRGHVALLYEDGVELPSDIAGVLFLRLDPEGAWKTRLAREMLEAGVPVDANAVLSA